MKVITITVSPDGKADIKGEGFVGTECVSAMKPFESMLGDNPEIEYSPEYFEEEENLREEVSSYEG